MTDCETLMLTHSATTVTNLRLVKCCASHIIPLKEEEEEEKKGQYCYS